MEGGRGRRGMIEEQGASNGDMGVPTSRWLPGESCYSCRVMQPCTVIFRCPRRWIPSSNARQLQHATCWNVHRRRNRSSIWRYKYYHDLQSVVWDLWEKTSTVIYCIKYCIDLQFDALYFFLLFCIYRLLL